MRKTAIVAFALLAALGCKQKTATYSMPVQQPPQQAIASPTPEQLGAIGAEIKKHPSEAKRILSEHGLDDATFEKAVRGVAADPAASRRYRDAYDKAI